jgi:hypothetical protein
VKRFLQRALARTERQLLAEVHGQLSEITVRLDAVSARLDDVQAIVEATAARAATLTEQTLGVVESGARTTRRFEEIERLLGATPPGNR